MVEKPTSRHAIMDGVVIQLLRKRNDFFQNYGDDMRFVNANFWKELELDFIVSNQFWELVHLSKGYKLINSKWIFKKKDET